MHLVPVWSEPVHAALRGAGGRAVGVIFLSTEGIVEISNSSSRATMEPQWEGTDRWSSRANNKIPSCHKRSRAPGPHMRLRVHPGCRGSIVTCIGQLDEVSGGWAV